MTNWQKLQKLQLDYFDRRRWRHVSWSPRWRHPYVNKLHMGLCLFWQHIGLGLDRFKLGLFQHTLHIKPTFPVQFRRGIGSFRQFCVQLQRLNRGTLGFCMEIQWGPVNIGEPDCLYLSHTRIPVFWGCFIKINSNLLKLTWVSDHLLHQYLPWLEGNYVMDNGGRLSSVPLM